METLQLLNQLLTTFLLAIALTTLRNASLYQNLLKVLNLWRKPLSCSLCLTTWTTLILNLTLFNLPLLYAGIFALVGGAIAEEIDKIQSRLF